MFPLQGGEVIACKELARGGALSKQVRDSQAGVKAGKGRGRVLKETLGQLLASPVDPWKLWGSLICQNCASRRQTDGRSGDPLSPSRGCSTPHHCSVVKLTVMTTVSLQMLPTLSSSRPPHPPAPLPLPSPSLRGPFLTSSLSAYLLW